MWLEDDFLKRPGYVRDISLQLQYKGPTKYDYWRGYRAEMPVNLFDEIGKDILDLLNINRANLKMFFAYQTKEIDVSDEASKHVDTSDFAGVIYLTPNPPKNTGTILYNDKENIKSIYENKYNRLIAYNSKILHAPQKCFGDNINNARMTITFFLNTERKNV